MYKSNKKIKELIEGYESEKDLHIEKCKECDYRISRSKTTTERVSWERIRDRAVKSHKMCDKNIEALENHPNSLFYIILVGVALVIIGVVNHLM